MQINPKQEFVKAIMSVLRIEPNLYTTGAIEKLIERLKVSDYQMFIAYLGEREAVYEKPIENIAKGVDEFYNMKLKPHRVEARKKQDKILLELSHLKKHLLINCENTLDKEEIFEYVEKHYSKQDESVKEYQRGLKTRELLNEKSEDFIIVECKKIQEKPDILKNLRNAETKESVLSDELISIIIEVGIQNILIQDDYYESDLIFNHIFTSKIKPSITNQITIKEYEKIYEPEQLSHKTKLLLNKPKAKNEFVF